MSGNSFAGRKLSVRRTISRSKGVAWIKLLANGEELDRRELTVAVVIGRSPECDVAVRDILLSRTHCRIEPCGRGGWKVVDLNSKNGTRVGWQAVQSHVLRDGDWLRMGRTRITFHVGEFEPLAQHAPRTDRLVRPADPHEALTGTVTDFVLLDEEESESVENSGPVPQPRPLEPVSFHDEETQSLLNDLASSYWSMEKSGTGTALACVRPVTRVVSKGRKPVYRSIVPQRQETDLSLQANEAMLTPLPTTVTSRRSKWMMRALVGTAVVVCTSVVMMSLWLLTMTPGRQ